MGGGLGMQTSRRTFLRVLGAAAIGLTLALPTRTWGHEASEAALRATATRSTPVGGAIDALVRRSVAKRATLVGWT